MRDKAKRAIAWARLPDAGRSRGEKTPREEGNARGMPGRRGTPWRRTAALARLPFRLIAQVLFLDVKLKREGKNLHVVLAARTPAPKRQSSLDKAIAEAAPLRAALKELLDQHPLTRQLMRHLGYLDRALATQGIKALTEMPVEVLAVSLEQLDSIVNNWSNRDLAELRSRLAVAVKDRSRHEGICGPLSDFATASRLLIDDVAHSEFEELQRQYEGLVSQETIQAALETIRTPLPVEPEATTAVLVTEPIPNRPATRPGTDPSGS